ncbi:hypothetical protein GCM10018775_32690 [Streptomyces umbrinus]|nr:hypothetical protein GCM10018775_32690 [Streptomyces umbrinus]
MGVEWSSGSVDLRIRAYVCASPLVCAYAWITPPINHPGDQDIPLPRLRPPVIPATPPYPIKADLFARVIDQVIYKVWWPSTPLERKGTDG